jgi:rhodanese-related sulfurtransferase
MKLLRILIALIVFHISCQSQPDLPHMNTLNPAFDRTVKSYLNFTVPVISCQALKQDYDSFLILDTRELEEYQISHLSHAIHIGFRNADISRLDTVPKDQPIVVYCSIGYRSEKIGEKLQKAGFSKVYNLYGSVFEWVNRGFPLVDLQGKETGHIHTYDRKWSRWVEAPGVEKVW